eukprot:2859316-Amphidinium_carterae.1
MRLPQNRPQSQEDVGRGRSWGAARGGRRGGRGRSWGAVRGGRGCRTNLNYQLERQRRELHTPSKHRSGRGRWDLGRSFGLRSKGGGRFRGPNHVKKGVEQTRKGDDGEGPPQTPPHQFFFGHSCMCLNIDMGCREHEMPACSVHTLETMLKLSNAH